MSYYTIITQATSNLYKTKNFDLLVDNIPYLLLNKIMRGEGDIWQDCHNYWPRKKSLPIYEDRQYCESGHLLVTVYL